MLTLAVSIAAAASGDSNTAPVRSPAGQIRVNFGASIPATDADGRTWDCYAPKAAGVAAAASYEDPSLPSTRVRLRPHLLDFNVS